MVDTMEPVSTKHSTLIPPVDTLMFGLGAINSSATAGCELVDSPAELWLGSSAGFSFPTAGKNGRTWQHVGWNRGQS